MYSHPCFFLSFCWLDQPESGRLALHAQSFLVDLIVDEELNKRIKQKYIYFSQICPIYFFGLFFYLLLHRLAVRIRLPFYDRFSTSYYCSAPGLLRHHSTVCCCGLANILYFRVEQPSSSSPSSSSSSSSSWSSSSSPSLSSSSSLLFEPRYPAIGSVE